VAILWLASFPKSGNTWLRAFLANYFANKTAPLSLEAVHGFGFSDAQAWPYQELTNGKTPIEMTEEEIAALRPRAHALLASKSADHVMVKTHNAIGNADGIPIITPKLTLGAIYVLRNPWDVTVSYADHYGLTLDQTIEALNSPDLKSAATVNQIPQYFSSWSNHLSSWQTAASIPLLTIYYEDMVHKPHETFGKVTHYLGLPPDAARLDRAIRFSSFDELSTQEDQAGFAEKSRHSLKFFRKGQIGGWRDVMSDQQAKRLADDHAAALRVHKYLTADGTIQEGRGN
jgi:hypothetical protein